MNRTYMLLVICLLTDMTTRALVYIHNNQPIYCNEQKSGCWFPISGEENITNNSTVIYFRESSPNSSLGELSFNSAQLIQNKILLQTYTASVSFDFFDGSIEKCTSCSCENTASPIATNPTNTCFPLLNSTQVPLTSGTQLSISESGFSYQSIKSSAAYSNGCSTTGSASILTQIQGPHMHRLSVNGNFQSSSSFPSAEYELQLIFKDSDQDLIWNLESKNTDLLIQTNLTIQITDLQLNSVPSLTTQSLFVYDYNSSTFYNTIASQFNQEDECVVDKFAFFKTNQETLQICFDEALSVVQVKNCTNNSFQGLQYPETNFLQLGLFFPLYMFPLSANGSERTQTPATGLASDSFFLLALEWTSDNHLSYNRTLLYPGSSEIATGLITVDGRLKFVCIQDTKICLCNPNNYQCLEVSSQGGLVFLVRSSTLANSSFLSIYFDFQLKILQLSTAQSESESQTIFHLVPFSSFTVQFSGTMFLPVTTINVCNLELLQVNNLVDGNVQIKFTASAFPNFFRPSGTACSCSYRTYYQQTPQILTTNPYGINSFLVPNIAKQVQLQCDTSQITLTISDSTPSPPSEEFSSLSRTQCFLIWGLCFWFWVFILIACLLVAFIIGVYCYAVTNSSKSNNVSNLQIPSDQDLQKFQLLNLFDEIKQQQQQQSQQEFELTLLQK